MHRGPGWWAYWLVARLSVCFLSGAAPGTWVARRSLATEEIEFGHSDIDLGFVLEPGSDSPENLCRLYRRFNLLRRFNPVLGGCLQIYRTEDFQELWSWDTAFASLETRSQAHLSGPDLAQVAEVDCLPQDGRRRFLLWFEAYFTLLHQRRRPREMEKVALELWNFFAVAGGSLRRPFLRRAEMRQALALVEPTLIENLRGAAAARVFSFGLVAKMHKELHTPLERLSRPMVFEAVIPPFGFRRPIVVLPEPETEPPPEFRLPGAFLVTPELLDLYVHHRNSYFYAVLPPAIRELGIRPPGEDARRQDLSYYSVHHFLFHPGFSPFSPHPEARLWILESELKALKSGSGQLDFSPEELAQKARWEVSVEEYYRTQYEAFGERTRSLHKSVI